MSEDDETTYNNTQRALLQVFLAKSILTFADAKPVLASILSAQDDREVLADDITEALWTSYVGALNSAISPLDYEIRSTVPQVIRGGSSTTTANANDSPPRVYTLVNTTSDGLTQLATIHTPDEIAFVKRLLDAIFDTYNTRREEVMAITSLQALRLNRPSRADQERMAAAAAAAAVPSGTATRNGAHDDDDENTGRTQVQQAQMLANQGLTKTEAQRMLDSLVAEGWMEISPRGYYSLSPRGLMELRGWLFETYNEPAGGEDEDDSEVPVEKVRTCQACKEIVTVGQRCKDLDCTCRLHDRCVAKVFRAQRGREKCPVCEKDWDQQTFVGERAARENQRTSGAANTTTAAGSSRRSGTTGGGQTNGGGGGSRRSSRAVSVNNGGSDDDD